MDLHLTEKKLTIKRVAHRLPCNIDHDGPAPTARAFCPFPEPLPSFRGHKLQSGKLNISESSQLIFVERQGEQNQDTANTSFSVKYVMEPTGFFYQHDDFPDINSAVPKALEWLSAAAALHDPVNTDHETTEKTDDRTHA